jgi:hypothetical protein
MQYMLLIYVDEARAAQTDEATAKAMTAEYFDYTRQIQESGNFVDGARLAPTASATTVRLRDGETLVTDGPYAETKEQLGGFYTVEAEDVDEAIALAARIPGARTGVIEVRPLPPLEAAA